MVVFSVLIAAVAPGVSLLLYFYLKDRYDMEPFQHVATMFAAGVIVVFPTILLERGLLLYSGTLADNHLYQAFVVAGGVEESMKWLVLLLFIYKHPVFDEPYDGIVYAVSVSLGYATLENIMYAWSHSLTFPALLLRALLPVSGHALFGVVMGYYLGKAKFRGSNKLLPTLFLSLFLPIMWHGSFDYIILTVATNWVWLMVPFMLYLWQRSIRKVNRANSRSPFRYITREEEIKF